MSGLVNLDENAEGYNVPLVNIPLMTFHLASRTIQDVPNCWGPFEASKFLGRKYLKDNVVSVVALLNFEMVFVVLYLLPLLCLCRLSFF
jgi:hypothetical protein